MTHPEELTELRLDSTAPWRDAVRDAVIPFVAFRVVLFGVAAFVNSYLMPGFASRALQAHGLNIFTESWNKFDSTFYLAIAEHGYSANSGPEWAFYPVFPVVVRSVGVLFGGGHTGT